MKTVNTVKDDESTALPAIFLGVCQNLAVSTSAGVSAAFGSTTGLIRVVSSVDCYISIGLNPTASSSTSYLPAGVVEYFGTSPGEKIAFKSVSDTGIFSITEAS
jgi:hypothetical protein